MLVTEFIEKKKRGGEHSQQEIREFITAYVRGKIPDYQMAAWLMAVNFQGMTDSETIALVEAMLQSGKRIDLHHIPGFKVDKHSTGGVGDKVSLILAPLATAAGCVVPMISGRSLGHSGGTLDKLESIPGFNVRLSLRKFTSLTAKYGLAMGGQTKQLVPADRKMYALRDVTATVKSIPLICGSILSKKIAEGIDGLVLDVKTGNGAFLTEYEQSRRLAQQLKAVGEHFGLKVKAVITDMNQPLGNTVGNWLEVLEAVDCLKGNGPQDLWEVTLTLTAWMLILAGISSDLQQAQEKLQKLIQSGAAYAKFLEMVSVQGGEIKYIENPDLYPRAGYIAPVLAPKSGYVHGIDTYRIGMLALTLGAGRLTIDTRIKPEVGLIVQKKIGHKVEAAEPLAVVHAASKKDYDQIAHLLVSAFDIQDTPATPPPLIYETF